MAYQLLINGQDYSPYVFSTASPTKLTWGMNRPQELLFGLIDGKLDNYGGLGPPEIDFSVQLDTLKYGDATFKGSIGKLETKLTGYDLPTSGIVYAFIITAYSQEYELNRMSARLGVLPNLQGRRSGDIIKKITELLLPGKFNFDNVDDGEYQPQFTQNADDVWTDIVGRLCNNDRKHYWILDGNVFFRDIGDAFLGVSYDPAANSPGWNASKFKISPTDDSIYNDYIVVGDESPKGPGKLLAVGDGTEGNYPLQVTAYGVQTSIIIDEPWDLTSGKVDTNKWEVEDPTLAIVQGEPNLQIIGGGGIENTFVRALQAIELKGAVRLIHGEVQEEGASDGRIGCLYKNFDSVGDDNQLCGWKIGDGVVQPMIDGILVGDPTAIVSGDVPPVATELQALHSYVLITRLFTGKANGWETAFFAPTDPAVQTGGQMSNKKLFMTFEVWDFSVVAAEQIEPVIKIVHVAEYDMSTLESPFMAYCPIQANDLHCALNSTEIAYPIQVLLRTVKATLNTDGIPVDWPDPPGLREKTVGFGIDRANATIGEDSGGYSQLQFYPDPVTKVVTDDTGATESVTTDTNLPKPGEKIELNFHWQGKALGRARDFANIAVQAAKYGPPDDGLRTKIDDKSSPLPRTDEDAYNAAAAYLTDAVEQQYQGSYDTFDQFFDGSRPIPGRYLEVNDAQNIAPPNPRSFIVTQVTDTMVGDYVTKADVHQISLAFGPLLTSTYFQAKLRETEGIPSQPGKDTEKLKVVDILAIKDRSGYLSDLIEDWKAEIVVVGEPWQTPPVPGSIKITVNHPIAPDEGIEIRRWDKGWGQVGFGTDPALIWRGAPGDPVAYIPRLSRSIHFYMRLYKGVGVISDPHHLLELVISPEIVALHNGDTLQLTATAFFQDGTSEDVTGAADWVSDTPAEISVAGGLLAALTDGPATVMITATFMGISTFIEVGLIPNTPLAHALTIVPAPTANIAVGGATQFTAILTLTDGTSSDVTSLAAWVSSDATKASITAGGLVTGVAIGQANISASYSGITSASTLVTVGPAVAPYGLQIHLHANGQDYYSTPYAGTMIRAGQTVPKNNFTQPRLSFGTMTVRVQFTDGSVGPDLTGANPDVRLISTYVRGIALDPITGVYQCKGGGLGDDPVASQHNYTILQASYNTHTPAGVLSAAVTVIMFPFPLGVA